MFLGKVLVFVAGRFGKLCSQRLYFTSHVVVVTPERLVGSDRVLDLAQGLIKLGKHLFLDKVRHL